MREKNICKNLTDIAGFVGVVLIIYLSLVARKGFTPTEDIDVFWRQPTNAAYIQLGVLLLVSSLINVLTRRIPTIGVAVSALPLWFCFDAMSRDLLTGRPVVYLVMCVVHFSGTLIYLGQWMMSEEPFGRGAVKSLSVSFSLAGISASVWLLSRFLLDIKYQKFFEVPFYIFTIYGAACGFISLYWAVKARREKARHGEALTVLSLAAELTNIAVLIARSILSDFGF